MDRRGFTTAIFVLASSLLRRRARAAEKANVDAPMPPEETIKPTLGGKQFWGDELFFHEWRIQRSALDGTCRLLDGQNRRHAAGSYDECRTRLEQIREQQNLPPMCGRAVVVLHGLFRSASSMARMCTFLRDEGNYCVFNVAYPTTRASVGQHASNLANILKHLDGVEEINFVAHSLGNLVIRRYLHDEATLRDGLDKRIRRMVMLGPPNNGARLAEVFGGNTLFHLVAGQSGVELGRAWQSLAEKLATPSCEFGIVAGGRSDRRGFNPLMGEDNDLVVSVETTRLGGAADFAVLPVLHTFMMDDPTVQKYTLEFLRHGHFVGPENRNPIPPPLS